MLNADGIFPLVVWVVVQTGLSGMHALVGHMERFVPEQQKHFGEAAMCLSLVEGECALCCPAYKSKLCTQLPNLCSPAAAVIHINRMRPGGKLAPMADLYGDHPDLI